MNLASGLDIGSKSIKGVRLQRVKDRVTLRDFAVQHLGSLKDE